MIWIKFGQIFMFTGVALGAFGAHALKEKMSDYYLGIYQTGVLYQFIHALALFVVAWLSTVSTDPKIAVGGSFFVAGIILFSGSLYALAITQMKLLGAVTPLGGLSFLIGWGILFFSYYDKFK
ncbi:MAG: DUF423 domain-containing protein [Candidatus Omnitrophica bacterium]|nr:DUF423 domain-containing protein [Candidatus Omnitrophota bacterium]